MNNGFHQAFSKLDSKKKRYLITYLEKAYEINLDFLKGVFFFITPKQKVYMTYFNPENLYLESINSFGIYFGTFHLEDKFRLSIEGTQLLDPQMNYLVLKDHWALSSYLSAGNLFEKDIAEKHYNNNIPYLIVKYNGENLGCVSKKEGYYLTYLPKSRKLDYNKVF